MRIRKCCCCLSLHTGCLIIAIMSLIFTFGTIFGSSESIMGGGNQVQHDSNGDLLPNNELAQQSNIIMKFIVCTVSIIFCILLIYGTAMKNRTMLKAWFILMGIQCVLVLVLVYLLIHAIKNAPPEAKSVVTAVLGVVIVELVLCCYCWLVVWSRYLELGDEETAAANINTAEGTKLNDVRASSNC